MALKKIFIFIPSKDSFIYQITLYSLRCCNYFYTNTFRVFKFYIIQISYIIPPPIRVSLILHCRRNHRITLHNYLITQVETVDLDIPWSGINFNAIHSRIRLNFTILISIVFVEIFQSYIWLYNFIFEEKWRACYIGKTRNCISYLRWSVNTLPLLEVLDFPWAFTAS